MQQRPAILPVVCIVTGDVHGEPDLYVRRLFDMLSRHCSQPFVLYCYTDRPRALPPEVQLRDCSGWTELARDGMHPTLRKLGIFNPAYVEFDSFLYLDLSIVIRRDMEEFLADAFSRPEPLLINSNWHYDGYNSSVMRVRRGPLQCVHEAFVAGEQYPQHVPGDQDFIHGAIAARGLKHLVGTFPAGQIVSFRLTAEAGRRVDPAFARNRIAQATIVKFHGQPKMHKAFGWRYRCLLRWRELWHGRLRPIMPIAELRREWEGSGR